MDAKKLIEGLPIEIVSKDEVRLCGARFFRREAVRYLDDGADSVFCRLSWRVLLALMDEQEPEWKVGDEAECDGVHFPVTEVVDLGEFGVKLRGHPHIADVNACACRHVPPPQGQPDLTQAASMPPVCAIHNRQMVIRFYSRGSVEPPGNIWSCPKCVEEGQKQPSDFFSGPEWKAIEDDNLEIYHVVLALTQCVVSLRDYLLAKEKS